MTCPCQKRRRRGKSRHVAEVHKNGIGIELVRLDRALRNAEEGMQYGDCKQAADYLLEAERAKGRLEAEFRSANPDVPDHFLETNTQLKDRLAKCERFVLACSVCDCKRK